LENFKEGDVVFIESINCGERAVFGDLVSKFLILYKQATAIIVNGYMRDAQRLIKEDYPIWCKGVTPLGCFNKEIITPIDEKILKEFQEQYSDAIAVCDDSGVVIIPKNMITNEFLEKLEFIELQEDIWYYCIDTKKWSTYDTVSLKKYLDTELLPDDLRSKFEEFLKKTQ
jgi:regulator of RNase E activity RraA